MTPNRYLLAFTVIFALLAGSILGVNYAVDPYGMNGRFDLGVWNRVKYETGSHARLHKAYTIFTRKPAVLAFGTSRFEAAVDMTHPGWAGTPAERYNAALGGLNIHEVAAYVGHALASGPVRQAVIGLDFVAFNALRPDGADFDPAVLLDPASPRSRLTVETTALRYYFSLTTLRSAWDTARVGRYQGVPFLATGQSAGQGHEAVRLAAGGQHTLFVRSERAFLSDTYFPAPLRKFALRREGAAGTLAEFAAMVRQLRDAGVDARFVIGPSHARQWEVIRAAGLWPRFEQWKRGLVAVLEADAGAQAVQAPYPLWDFSGYNSVTTEAVPASGDAVSVMKYYWESSHYTPAAANLMLDRVLDHPDPSRPLPADFGVRLTAANLDAHLASIRDAQQGYARTHRADRAEIDALAEQYVPHPEDE